MVVVSPARGGAFAAKRAGQYDCPDIRKGIMQPRGIAGVILCTAALAVAFCNSTVQAATRIRLARN
jgi:hypothetical protein